MRKKIVIGVGIVFLFSFLGTWWYLARLAQFRSLVGPYNSPITIGEAMDRRSDFWYLRPFAADNKGKIVSCGEGISDEDFAKVEDFWEHWESKGVEPGPTEISEFMDSLSHKVEVCTFDETELRRWILVRGRPDSELLVTWKSLNLDLVSQEIMEILEQE